MSTQEKCLLLGFGDIAQRLSRRLSGRYQLSGVRRRSIAVNGIATFKADIAQPEQIRPILDDDFDVIVLTMTPSEMSDDGYRRAYVQTTQSVLNVLDDLSARPRLIVFVSSTSVYGQQDGEWVDESSATEPGSYSGKRLLEAENLLRSSDYNHCCVRFSGIYGPGRRRLIDQVLSGKGSHKTPIIYSNRIHAEDGAGILAHVIEKQSAKAHAKTIEALYLASDCEPSPMYDVKVWLAKQLDLSPDALSPTESSRQLGNKRCRNNRILTSGYRFQYPDYRTGYRRLINDLKARGELF
ncbi:MAG: nucleoside-diphosphate-sugar epimerase [Cellvibrionaceae bacterium]|jgi:nucleoside-diphosphate-sugar epimerase